MKLTCTAHIPDDTERSLVCEWLQETDGCDYSVIGTTVTAAYTQNSAPDSVTIYRGIIRLFEQYAEHSIYQSAGKEVKPNACVV